MKITIKRNEHDEFEVPTAFRDRGSLPKRPCAIYYTDDKDDAEGTARYHYGDSVVIRHTRGTYDD